MRLIPLVAAVAAVVVPAAPAFAGDPIMPLSQVQAGMRCTGYSVFQGTTISSFDVLVLDVAAGEASDGAGRILFEASGPAIDATGVGPGFSGSPIYCPDAAGVSRNIGAISESVMEYGGKVALATPIESIIGTPVDPPGPAVRGRRRVRGPRRGAQRSRRGCARALARARPLASPLTVSGVTGPIAQALTAAGAKVGRPVLAVPPGPLGVVRAADAAAGVGGRRRILDRRRQDELGRDRGVRRRRPRVGVRPRARGRRAARAAAAGRLRVPDRQQPAPARAVRRDLQARGVRARPGHDQLGRVQRGRRAHRRAAAHGPGAR